MTMRDNKVDLFFENTSPYNAINISFVKIRVLPIVRLHFEEESFLFIKVQVWMYDFINQVVH